jgi:SAM-dependent methyltransferase
VIPTECWTLPRPRPCAYPGGWPLWFEQKLHRLLGNPEKTLNMFAGLSEKGVSVDLNASTLPTFVGDCHDLRALGIEDDSFDLVLADPPYSDHESEWIYGTPPLRQSEWVREAVRVCKPGGFVALYHVRMLPRPEGTRLVHRVVVLTRVNHTARICMVYRKELAKQPLSADDESRTQMGQRRDNALAPDKEA